MSSINSQELFKRLLLSEIEENNLSTDKNNISLEVRLCSYFITL